ncbi:MAG: alpha/beta hydrolase domain-containing protein, partial [Chloroflexota bacterium]|nr:alpha/beta hydrolase domain-containing protein [Chloroflexota bacterium]
TLPNPDRLPVLRRYDLGPEADRGIGRYPAAAGDPYAVYVSAVDADGNEVAGVRMPDLAVPVATYTGWNPRAPESGGPGQIIPMQGSTFPFAPSAVARARAGDPRPSVAERYRGRDDYLARVRAAAEGLVARRHLLAEDLDLALQLAAESYDYVTGTAGGGGGT